MSLHSITSQYYSVRILALAVAAALATGHPASAAESNPFAGCYWNESFPQIDIDHLGNIRGSWSGYTYADFGARVYETRTLRGSISSSGSMAITQVITRYDANSGKRIDRFSSKESGVGGLNSLGDLYGVLYFKGGGSREFYWPLCE